MIGVGDEVIYLGDSGNVPDGFEPPDVKLVSGSVYVVSSISSHGVDCPDCNRDVWIEVHGGGPFDQYCVCGFAKPKRRNLTEWLSQKTKFEEPKRIGENA